MCHLTLVCKDFSQLTRCFPPAQAWMLVGEVCRLRPLKNASDTDLMILSNSSQNWDYGMRAMNPFDVTQVHGGFLVNHQRNRVCVLLFIGWLSVAKSNYLNQKALQHFTGAIMMDDRIFRVQDPNWLDELRQDSAFRGYDFTSLSVLTFSVLLSCTMKWTTNYRPETLQKRLPTFLQSKHTSRTYSREAASHSADQHWQYMSSVSSLHFA